MKRRSVLVALAALTCAAAGPPRLSAAGAQGLGARALGMAGAGAARGVEAYFWDAAGLAATLDPEIGLLSGLGGPAAEAQQAAVLVLPLEGLGVLAVGGEDGRLLQGGAFREDRVGLGLALPLGAWAKLGTRQSFLSAAPGGLSGWSMDLGLELDLARGLWGGRGLSLQLGARDLASALAWENGADGSLPPLFSLGATWLPWPGASLAARLDLEERRDLGRASQWRVGAEQAWLKGLLALRLGASAHELSGAFVTAGLGLALGSSAGRWRLDYGLALPSSGGPFAGQDLRHLLTLSLALERPHPRPAAGLRDLRQDPQTLAIQRASLALDAEADPDSKAWELVLRGEDGRVLRSFRGQGRPPLQLDWDGQDEDGVTVRSASLSYSLRVTRASGEQVARRGILLGRELLSQELGQVAGHSLRSSYALRAGALAPEEQATAVGVKPVLRLGGGGPELSGAAFDLSHIASRQVKRWQLKVVDEQGRTLKTFAGQGRPPKSLSWEGLSDPGQPALRRRGAGYVLRVVDQEERESSEAGGLLRPEVAEQARLPGARPRAAELRALAQGLGNCKLSQDLSECSCVFKFDSARTEMVLDDRVPFWNFLEFARLGGYTDWSIRGHCDDLGSDAFNLSLSERRAEEVERWLLRKGLKPARLEVAGFGAEDPVAPNDTPEDRLKNRRVEVTLRSAFSLIDEPKP